MVEELDPVAQVGFEPQLILQLRFDGFGAVFLAGNKFHLELDAVDIPELVHNDFVFISQPVDTADDLFDGRGGQLD